MSGIESQFVSLSVQPIVFRRSLAVRSSVSFLMPSAIITAACLRFCARGHFSSSLLFSHRRKREGKRGNTKKLLLQYFRSFSLLSSPSRFNNAWLPSAALFSASLYILFFFVRQLSFLRTLLLLCSHLIQIRIAFTFLVRAQI